MINETLCFHMDTDKDFQEVKTSLSCAILFRYVHSSSQLKHHNVKKLIKFVAICEKMEIFQEKTFTWNEFEPWISCFIFKQSNHFSI